jgi:thiol-disulfide isomerase/thioredoxin
VRTLVGVALVSACLGLTGCSLFGKKQAAQTANPKPFLGSENSAPTERAAIPENNNSGGVLPGASGLLAGQVIDASTGKPVNARIDVVDLLEDPPKGAAIQVDTAKDGYFTIFRLKPGGHYKLTVRSRDEGELASQVVIVRPPDARLIIRVSKQFTTPSTPTDVPGKRESTGADGDKDRKPAADLAPPVKLPPEKEGDSSKPSSSGAGARQRRDDPPNISNIANDGFARAPKSPLIEIPNPAEQYRSLPWPPPSAPEIEWKAIRDERRSPAPPPITSPARSSVHVPTTPTRVPSCLLIGNKLENFALLDLDEQRWEYKQKRRGRLVLLNFWYSTCPACKHAIPHLVDLEKGYGQFGLQVIGIACETGTVMEQISRIRSVRGRYNMNYLTLLGGQHDNSPIVKQFGVASYPTLVLLDESGKIIWRSHPRDGMDDYAWRVLDRLIADKLFKRAKTP